MSDSYVPPSINSDAFTCPHCGVNSQMVVNPIVKNRSIPDPLPLFTHGNRTDFWNFCMSAFEAYDCFAAQTKTCAHCGKFSLWVNGDMVWPELPAVQPSEYLPETARKAFDEAQKVIGRSPQCACAMLRLSLERLVVHLGGTGRNLRDKVLSLNLSPNIERLCDACRIVGNDAVHEGLLFVEPDDTYDRAVRLSNFVNWITERTLAADAAADKILNR